MVEEEDSEEMSEQEIFDTSKTSIEYHRSRDTKRVTVTMKDPAGISEMKLYLLLCMEIEKLERRLGINEAQDGQH